MKKKYYLSLATGILSALTAFTFAAIVLRSIISISEVVTVIQDITDELFGLNLVSYAMVSFLTAILGIAISVALAGYRATLAYFYIRVAFSDENFYKERKKDCLTFSIFGAVMFSVLLVAYFALEGRIEKNITNALIVFIFAYALMIVLPILERQMVSSLEAKKKTPPTISAAAFDKAKIAAELDSSFAKTVKDGETAQNADKDAEAQTMDEAEEKIADENPEAQNEDTANPSADASAEEIANTEITAEVQSQENEQTETVEVQAQENEQTDNAEIQAPENEQTETVEVQAQENEQTDNAEMQAQENEQTETVEVRTKEDEKTEQTLKLA